jgi:hypothetical protein
MPNTTLKDPQPGDDSRALWKVDVEQNKLLRTLQAEVNRLALAVAELRRKVDMSGGGGSAGGGDARWQ